MKRCEIKMITDNEITAIQLVIFFSILLIFIVIMLIFLIYLHIKNKIHESFHKGYNEARSDKYNYFENLRDLDDNFTKIMKEIKNKKLELHIGLVSDLLDFGHKIRKYKNKN